MVLRHFFCIFGFFYMLLQEENSNSKSTGRSTLVNDMGVLFQAFSSIKGQPLVTVSCLSALLVTEEITETQILLHHQAFFEVKAISSRVVFMFLYHDSSHMFFPIEMKYERFYIGHQWHSYPTIGFLQQFGDDYYLERCHLQYK